MAYITVGKQYGVGKIANVQCVKNDLLKDVRIKDECFLLLIVTEGCVRFAVNGCEYAAQAPCFVCLNEQHEAAFVTVSPNGCQAVYFQPTFLNVNMTPNLLRDAVYEDLVTNHDLFLLKPFVDGPRIIPMQSAQLEKAQAAFEGMHHELTLQRDWYWSCRARSYFMELVILVERVYGLLGYGDNEEAPDAAAAVDDERLRKALLYIESMYSRVISFEDIVLAAGVNRATLSALFKKEWGITPMQYLMRHRIGVAEKAIGVYGIVRQRDRCEVRL